MTVGWSDCEGNGMSDDDFVVADEDFLDEQSYDALTLDDIKGVGRAQTLEKCGQCFGDTRISNAVGRLVCNRLQLGTDCVRRRKSGMRWRSSSSDKRSSW